MSELFTRPKFFKDVTFHRHTDRQVGWLELFYDLVYVATLIQVGNFLSDNLTLVGFGQFLVLMFVVWWAWSGETLYQNRYVVDDIWHRLLIFIQIFGVATIGLSVSDAFGDLYIQFTFGYVLVRSMMLVMYARAYTNHPESRALSVGFLVGFGGGIAIWLGSLFLPADFHWVGWLVAIAFEMVFFFRPSLVRALLQWGTDEHHMVERFGIFTIIVLGETFVKVLDDAQGTALGIEQILFGIISLVVLYSLWWLYFGDTAGKLYDTNSNIKPGLWSYGHLILATSLVAFGVSVKKLFAQTTKYPNETLPEDYRLLFTVAVVLFLLAMALIDYGIDDAYTTRSQRKSVFLYVIFIGVVTAVGWLVTGVTATQFTAIIAVLMLILVAYNVYQTANAPEPSHEHHAE
jgi:low temperature requirement protein LtrA